MKIKSALAALLLLFLSLALTVPTFAGNGQIIKAAGEKIPDQYIVVFRRGANAAEVANALVQAHGGEVGRVFSHALNGAVMRLPEQAARAVARNPNVEFVEEDQVVTLDGSGSQSGATWGLDRVDQRNLPLNGVYNWDFSAPNVHIYIIDTGIRTSHNDFGGRATADFDSFGGNGQDCNGHGTHVAGTAAGSTWGVAKDARLHAVRVLNCSGSGSNSGVIAGVDWVTANHISPAVANMSLGGGISSALDAAVNNSFNAGVFYAVAAGNSNANACNTSPARAANAYTVAASTSSDARASFSNWGSCVEIFAPGQTITSAWYTSDSATNTISGTSMASPHVAGAAALVRDEFPSFTPAQVANELTARATSGVISNPSGSPNLLLFTLGDGGPPPPPPPPPGEDVVYSENFDNGSAPGWNKSSGSTDLWRVSSDCVSAASGSYKIAFSRSAPNCDYDVGRATGWARSPTINLSGYSQAWLNFNHFWETESFNGNYDVMQVQMSGNGGSTWTTVATWNSSDPNPSVYLDERIPVPSSMINSSFRVRFFFDSQDGIANDFLGWYVDDVEVTAQ